ncbi:MAG: hypothetical protein HY811_10140 [Planctomycetes bacterium]|nr:hypothetical protein [Planctomycetota bacterium]
MKKLIVVFVSIAVLFFLFNGCSASSSSSYRPAGSTSAAWQINGNWNKTTGVVTITINGTEVIKSAVGAFSSSKTLEGTHDGHKVTAVLTKTTSLLGQSGMVCMVMVDGEIAAKFEW